MTLLVVKIYKLIYFIIMNVILHRSIMQEENKTMY